MSTFFPAYIVSILLGWLIVLACAKETSRTILSFFLAIGLGLGLSAQLSFYSFLLVGQFSPQVLLVVNLLAVFALLILNRKSLFEICKNTSFQPVVWIKGLGAATLLVLMFHFIYVSASVQPFGQWDAWAVWNMKTKFLILGEKEWTDIFKLHWHTQPDYPLLLPFMNTWAYAIPLRGFHFIPALTGIIFTVACAGLLYAGLKLYIPAQIAFLSALSLFILPVYLAMGASQYADMPTAYYLLAAFVLLTITLREKKHGTAALSGMTLGFMTFLKNEGIVISFLLLILSCLHLIFDKTDDRSHNMKVMTCLLLGLAITLPPIVILKLFLAPTNRDIGMFALGCLKFFNLESLGIILRRLAFAMLDLRSGFIWAALTFMFFLQIRRYFHKEILVLTLFFILYLLSIFWVYLTTVNFDLDWRLSRTIIRILAIQLPAVLFLNFYVYWRRD